MRAAGFIFLNKIIQILLVLLILSACAGPTKITVPVPTLSPTITVIEQLVEVTTTAVNDEVEQAEVNKLCAEVGQRLSSVSAQGCLSHELLHGKEHSVNGRALVYKDYFSADDTAAKILVIGGIHGDEYSSFSLLFRWLEHLDKQAVYKNNWRLLPMSNPDGLLSFRPAHRVNANGVDLNRNFNTGDWKDKALRYWRDKTGSDKRRNPGPKADSEVETRWISGAIKTWQPDIIVAVHAPYGILDFDSPQPKHFAPPKKIGMLHLNLLGTYPGSLGRYGSKDRNIPVLTLELPHAGIMPSKSQQQDLWQDLQNWLMDNVNR